MRGFLKRRSATHDLSRALKTFLLGMGKTEDCLRERYKNRWDGFIDDIVNGTSPQDQALTLVTIFILDVMGHDMTDNEARNIADIVYDKKFFERPPLFDVIDQVGYFAYLLEKNKEIKSGMFTMFLNEIMSLFGDDVRNKNLALEYFAESISRFGQNANVAVKQGSIASFLLSGSQTK